MCAHYNQKDGCPIFRSARQGQYRFVPMRKISEEAVLRRQPSDGWLLCRGNRAATSNGNWGATFSDLIESLNSLVNKVSKPGWPRATAPREVMHRQASRGNCGATVSGREA